jgi:hypothetical protein
MATYGRGQMLGSGINPESFKLDYSGFANAAATQAQGMANLGASIGGVIKDFADEKKQINQDIAKGKSALQFAKANYPELAGRIDEIGKIFSDVNVSKADQAAAGSQMGDFVTAMIRGQEFNTEIGLKKRELGIREAQNIAELAAKNREIQAKSDQRISDSIFIGGRDVAVTKDGFGNIYDPKTDKLIIDQGAYQAGREDYSRPTNQSNQDTGDLLQRSLELNDPTFGSQEASNALFPDGVAPQGNPMPAGTPTTTAVPKVDGVPTPRGTPRATGGSETYRPFTPEEIARYGSEGQVSSTGKVYPIRPPSGTKFTTNPDGSVTYETGAGVGAKAEKVAKAERAAKFQETRQTNFIIDKANEAEEIIDNSISTYGGGTLIDMAKSTVPGTQEYKLKNQILPALKDSIALDSIRQLKAASPTGSTGLGSVTEKEGQRLENMYGVLDINGDKVTLKNDIKRLKQTAFDYIHGSKSEREEALAKGDITKDQNDQVEKMYREQILGVKEDTKQQNFFQPSQLDSEVDSFLNQ